MEKELKLLKQEETKKQEEQKLAKKKEKKEKQKELKSEKKETRKKQEEQRKQEQFDIKERKQDKENKANINKDTYGKHELTLNYISKRDTKEPNVKILNDGSCVIDDDLKWKSVFDVTKEKFPSEKTIKDFELFLNENDTFEFNYSPKLIKTLNTFKKGNKFVK